MLGGDQKRFNDLYAYYRDYLSVSYVPGENREHIKARLASRERRCLNFAVSEALDLIVSQNIKHREIVTKMRWRHEEVLHCGCALLLLERESESYRFVTRFQSGYNGFRVLQRADMDVLEVQASQQAISDRLYETFFRNSEGRIETRHRQLASMPATGMAAT